MMSVDEMKSSAQLRDTCLRSSQGGTKIPKLILLISPHRVEHGGSIHCSALVVAAWLRMLSHHDEQGKDIAAEDDKADKLGLTQAVEQGGKDARQLVQKASPVFAQ